MENKRDIEDTRSQLKTYQVTRNYYKAVCVEASSEEEALERAADMFEDEPLEVSDDDEVIEV